MSRVLCAMFADEHHILEATSAARQAGIAIQDVYTPYPVHGMEDAMGLRPSRLTWVTFVMALVGLSVAWWFQHWVNVTAWPLNIGGKPFNALPAFIPVGFEVTVLFAGLGTVFALFVRTRLRPRATARVAIPGVTNDRFALVVSADGEHFDEGEARRLFEAHHASSIDWMEIE